MAPEASLITEIISQAESYDGIRAGIVRLEDVLKGPSYQAAPEDPGSPTTLDDVEVVNWLPEARPVLILGLYHPVKEPRLDWWEQGDFRGSRQLREISASLKYQLREEHGLKAQPLPYHLENGGLFLKDAAVLSGMGIIGRNNLLLNPEWSPDFRSWYSSSDWLKFAIQLPLENNLGDVFNYNPSTSHLLSFILSKSSKASMLDFAKQNLFEPIGMQSSYWHESPQGYYIGGFGLGLSPRDLAKFGFLYLNNGFWNGRSIVPECWVKESRRQ